MCSCLLYTSRHHLSGRRVTAHVGVAQIDIVLVDSHNTVHHLFHLGFLITLRIPPVSYTHLAIADEDYKDVAYFEPFYLKEFVASMPKKLL